MLHIESSPEKRNAIVEGGLGLSGGRLGLTWDVYYISGLQSYIRNEVVCHLDG